MEENGQPVVHMLPLLFLTGRCSSDFEYSTAGCVLPCALSAQNMFCQQLLGSCTNACTEDRTGALLLSVLYFCYSDCNYDYVQCKYTEYGNQVIEGIK